MAHAIPTAEEIRDIVREELRRALDQRTPDPMTVEQAAAYRNKAVKTIRAWILAGLPVTRKRRRVYIQRADLDAWVARPEQSTDALVASLRSAG